MDESSPTPQASGKTAFPIGTRFNLIRWFSAAALLSVAFVSAVAAWALSIFLTTRMIHGDAEVTAGVVRSLVRTEGATAHFDAPGGLVDRSGEFLHHVKSLPDVVRVNIYSAQRQMVWSTDAALIGRRFETNEELDEALDAKLVVSSGVVASQHAPKSEHQDIEQRVAQFVESYIPVFDDDGRRVVAVIEVYKVPNGLFDAIRAGTRLIWAAAAAAGFFLYLTLFWVVRRAHRIIETQREQLIEAESLAVVGEMGSAVAHGLRNPLASIRSSAELALESALPPQARDCANDIVAQVDRLEAWIRQLLTYARPAHAPIQPVDVNAVLRDVFGGYRRDLERRGTAGRLDLADALPPVRGEPAILGQIFGSLIANAMEALQQGGEIVLHSHLDQKAHAVVVEFRDNGPGMSPDALGKAFKPFFTSKSKGLGLGLPLVRRVIERLGGSVVLSSAPGAGTTVRMTLPTYS